MPGDVALIGVDNWEQLMHDQRVSRHLTTIDVGLEEIGRQVAAQLLEPEPSPASSTSPLRSCRGDHLILVVDRVPRSEAQ